MKRTLKISNLEKKIRSILEQEQNQESEWIEMTPDEFKTLMKFVNYHGDYISRIKGYRNKLIKVNGDLSLENTPTTSLGPLRIVTGYLNVNQTNIKSLEGIKTKYATYWSTPLKKEEERRKMQKLIDDAQDRRESGEWDIDDTDQVGEYANVLFQYFVEQKTILPRNELVIARVQELENKLKELEAKEEEYDEEGKSTDDIVTDIEVTNDEIEELNKRIDVYNLSPIGTHWDLQTYMVLDSEEIDSSEEWAVGNSNDVERSVKQYWDDYVDQDLDNFSEHLLENNLDTDSVRSDVESDYDYDVRENPESYLDDSQRELSESQESEIQELQTKKQELEQKLYDMDPDDDEYETTQDEITEIDDEIESIQDDPQGDFKEDDIQDKIDSLVDQTMRDPVSYLKYRGVDLKNYVDTDSLAQEFADSEGYGVLSSYDGDYNEINFNGEYYYIFRIN